MASRWSKRHKMKLMHKATDSEFLEHFEQECPVLYMPGNPGQELEHVAPRSVALEPGVSAPSHSSQVCQSLATAVFVEEHEGIQSSQFKLLAAVTELTKEVRDLRQEFREFRQSCRCGQPVAPVGQPSAEPIELPLHNFEELDQAEAILQTQSNRKAMTARLIQIGGTTCDVRVRRMLAHTLTNELASGLNWAGKRVKDSAKQKRPFRELTLCKCIFDALTQQIGPAGVSQFAFAQAVQKWLRYAPDRVGGAGREKELIDVDWVSHERVGSFK